MEQPDPLCICIRVFEIPRERQPRPCSMDFSFITDRSTAVEFWISPLVRLVTRTTRLDIDYIGVTHCRPNDILLGRWPTSWVDGKPGRMTSRKRISSINFNMEIVWYSWGWLYYRYRSRYHCYYGLAALCLWSIDSPEIDSEIVYLDIRFCGQWISIE